jgi:hypothetical protein
MTNIFYKYTEVDSAIKILLSEKVLFKAASEFNDPFEFQQFYKLDGPDEVRDDESQEYLQRKTKIFCLSKKRDEILMWSHYAAQYLI